MPTPSFVLICSDDAKPPNTFASVCAQIKAQLSADESEKFTALLKQRDRKFQRHLRYEYQQFIAENLRAKGGSDAVSYINNAETSWGKFQSHSKIIKYAHSYTNTMRKLASKFTASAGSSPALQAAPP